MLVGAPFGCDNDVAVAILAIDQGKAPRLPRSTAECGQDESRGATPYMAIFAVGFDIAADVIGDPALRAVNGLLVMVILVANLAQEPVSQSSMLQADCLMYHGHL